MDLNIHLSESKLDAPEVHCCASVISKFGQCERENRSSLMLIKWFLYGLLQDSFLDKENAKDSFDAVGSRGEV